MASSRFLVESNIEVVVTFAEFPLGHMDKFNFFQGLVIVLAIAFLSVGGGLLHESISNPATQPWELLGGALLCSLALMFAYLLWKQRAGRKYL
jgi:hypothetical protein